MKKLISLLSAAAMLAGMTATTAFAADTVVKGDADRNGKVEYADVNMILKYTAEEYDYKFAAPGQKEEIERTVDADYETMDVTGDGEITPEDSTAILCYIVCRDFGTEIELKPENISAILRESARLDAECYLVEGTDEKGNMYYYSDKSKYVAKKLDYLCTYDSVESAAKVKSSDEYRYYKKLRPDGMVDLYYVMGDLALGDADLDGIVDARDATKILVRYADTLLNGTDAKEDNLEADYCADYNMDGSIDSLDATAVLIAYAEELLG